jgi:L-alanine-DL-glutamate epimerase-like enolase superfamily enzyme
LIVELHTDEGVVGVGEAPGPTLPAIQAVIEREFAQFLVDQDPLRTERLVHRLEEYSRNWAGLAAYAIAGVELALLDLKGKVLGAPVAELLGGFGRESVPVVGYLFIDEPEANAQKAAEFVGAGHTELKLKVGRDLTQDYDAIAAIRERIGYDVKLRIDANMNWSVPAAIKWIKALEQFDLQFVEQPVPDYDIAGLAQVRRSVSVPIAADEACTTLRSALELIKADACDVFVVYPSEAGGLTRALQIAALATAAGKWCAVGSWAELGVATIANAHLAAASESFPFANDTHYPLQLNDVLTDPVVIENGQITVTHDPGLGVELDAVSLATLAALELRESPFYDDIQGDAPSVGQIF